MEDTAPRPLMEEGTDEKRQDRKGLSPVERLDWIAAVMRDGALTRDAQCVAAALACRQNSGTGQCNPSLKTLAADTSFLDVSPVSRALTKLRKAGWIESTRNRRTGGNAYRLLRQPLAQMDNHPFVEMDNSHLLISTNGTCSDEQMALVEQDNSHLLGSATPYEYRNGSQEGTGEVEPVKPENTPASVGDDVASIGGDDDGLRHDALSGECEFPQGAVPDIAEGDLGEAVGGGVDEPFPSEWPDDAEGVQGEARNVDDDDETHQDIADDASAIHHLGDIDISAPRLAELEKKFGPSAMSGLLARQGDIVKACEGGVSLVKAVDDALSEYFPPF